MILFTSDMEDFNDFETNGSFSFRIKDLTFSIFKGHITYKGYITKGHITVFNYRKTMALAAPLNN